MKVSSDFQTLIGYHNTSPLEVAKIWNLQSLAMIHEEILDLEDRPEL